MEKSNKILKILKMPFEHTINIEYDSKTLKILKTPCGIYVIYNNIIIIRKKHYIYIYYYIISVLCSFRRFKCSTIAFVFSRYSMFNNLKECDFL